MKQKAKLLFTGILTCMGIGNLATAQLKDLNSESQQNVQCSDPIVEMLDSLVTLNNVIRYNNYIGASAGQTDIASLGIPQFSEQEYRERISKISTPIPLIYNEQVRNYIDMYAVKKHDLTSRVLGLSNLYFPLFEEILDKEGLPLEFKYLSVVESALNPTAVSRVGATGIWQFMLNTGRLYDLKVNSFTDERRDPVKATYAACKYFRDMYEIYHDWLLVIAAYNCGAGNVNHAIIRSGGKTNFWEISRYLPSETRGYVPAFIAVCYVMNYAAEHNLIPVPPAYSYFEVDTLRIQQKTTLAKIAKSVDLPLDVVYYLNPEYKKRIVPATSEAQIIRLPANKISAFIANGDNIFSNDVAELAPILASLSSRFKRVDNEEVDGIEYTYKQVKKTHTVRRGETLAQLADRYDCTSGDIKKLNKLKSSKLRSGQRLKILAWVKTKQASVSAENRETTNVKGESSSAIAAYQNMTSPESGIDVKTETTDSVSEIKSDQSTKENNIKQEQYVYHLVQKGDTLWNIARRYEGATVDQIMELNQITNNKNLKTGSRIKVMIAG